MDGRTRRTRHRPSRASENDKTAAQMAAVVGLLGAGERRGTVAVAGVLSITVVFSVASAARYAAAIPAL